MAEADLQKPPAPRRPATRTQAARSSETRERVIAAAIAILDAKGYAGAAVANIAKLGGVSIGALQHQFPTKASLMAVVIERAMSDRAQRYTSAVEGIADPVLRSSAILDAAWAMAGETHFAAVLEIQLARRSDPELDAAVGPVFEQADAELDRWLFLVTLADRQVSSERAHLSRLCNNIILRGAAILRIETKNHAEIDATYDIWKPLVMKIGFDRDVAVA